MLAGFAMSCVSFLIHAGGVLGNTPIRNDLDHGTAEPGEPYWLETMKHQGTSAYNSDPTYEVFRNVKDFGAKGDGITDDTAAINLAISTGNRCGFPTGCTSSTLSPALVYFPQGTYLVSQPIIAYYYTQLVGDAVVPPTLLASENFDGIAVIDVDPYLAGGAQWYPNTNNFLRTIRNFIIDVRRVAPERSQGTGIHWQVAQATSLYNIVFEMSTAPNTAHQGIWMENGSGGFMGDLVFNGGKYGLWIGNQQFTARNITVNNAQTAIFNHWTWGWTYQRITINNCTVGFEFLGGVAAASIIDAVVNDTPLFISSAAAASSTLVGSLVLNNIHLHNVTTTIGVPDGPIVVAGGEDTVIESWGQGNVYSGVSSEGSFVQGDISAPYRPPALLDSSGRIFGKSRPQYAGYSSSQFVSAKTNGAKGDGVSDDTEAIQELLNTYAGQKVIFFDAGTYIVTSTIIVPPETRIVGEAWSVIAGKGPAFENQEEPNVVVQVGESGSVGVVEITDIIFTTVGPTAGAIVVEWNIRGPENQKGAAGMWDSHIRLGGAVGTNLQADTCSPEASNTDDCMAAFLALHLTQDSSAYLEGTWVWLADHDLDGNDAFVTLYSGRGILSESRGPVWMIGTAEHHVLYQYRFVDTSNHYIGLMQTESPYWQPSPAAPHPFSVDPTFKDPDFLDENSSAWAVSIKTSRNIIIFGADLYSFYNNYSQTCLDSRNCQTHIFDIDSDSLASVYSLSTISSAFQLTIDGTGVVNQGDNVNGLPSTVTAWNPSN